MATIMLMRWEGVTPEQYDAVREAVAWDVDPPRGGIFHVARFEDGALHVVDVWESPEDFARFQAERLAPGVRDIGIGGEPEVRFAPAHAYSVGEALRAQASAAG